MSRAYRNPTEDAAIGNVMREERRKQHDTVRNAVQPKKRSRERQRENRRLKHKREG